jgi:hypothetical protein
VADRSFLIGPGAGLLDGIWTTPMGAFPGSPADAPNEGQPASSNPPGLLMAGLSR